MNLTERQIEMKDRVATELTPREKDALRFLFGGHSNRGIAQQMSITENAVKRYLHLAYMKLGIHGDRELFPLVIAAQRENLTKLLVSE
jgi:DNA-binding NarL/FixJ family response regulator